MDEAIPPIFEEYDRRCEAVSAPLLCLHDLLQRTIMALIGEKEDRHKRQLDLDEYIYEREMKELRKKLA